MTRSFQVTVQDHTRAEQLSERVKLGHYFVYVDYDKNEPKKAGGGRFARLLVNKPDKKSKRKVLPAVKNEVVLPGVTIQPPDPRIEPLCAVVCDRDLYRAEQDTINLFVAAPDAPVNLRLVIEHNGQHLTQRELELQDGVAIESLSMLLPGSYTAQLADDDDWVGAQVSFTVAEYTLAPLSARLVSHKLDRETDTLHFELEVESYQVPFTGKLAVALVEKGREVERCKALKPKTPGRYAGSIRMVGEGPFRLRLTAADDAERVAEVAIPGSRARERDMTVVSELGAEMLFSMMPEPNALPLRGGYLSEGDAIATPLTIDSVVAAQPVFRAHADLESLVLVSLDLASGSFDVHKMGDVSADSELTLDVDSSLTMVVAGCFVNGQPFEGFTTCVTPSQLSLTVEAPQTVRPGEDLVIKLACSSTSEPQSDPDQNGHPYRSPGSVEPEPIPVLLWVRDQRLTATDKPDTSLGAALKRGVAQATAGMADSAFVDLAALMPQPAWPPPRPSYSGQARLEIRRPMPPPSGMPAPISEDYDDEVALCDAEPEVDAFLQAHAPPPMAPAARSARPLMARLKSQAPPEMVGQSMAPSQMRSEEARSIASQSSELFAEKPIAEISARADNLETQAPTETPPVRTELPEQLFYGLVTVSARGEEVTIPLGDALSTFTVEAFALKEGDWLEARTTVVVDKPVRLDLELPLAVHEKDDKIEGRLRVATPSGSAKVTLLRDGKPVSLHGVEGDQVKTPAELRFVVEAGTYQATVQDPDSGEVDAAEAFVGTPGTFKSYAKVLGLMQPGDEITLDSADAQSLRVLPAVDESFDMLVSATAGYAHLCCEQTAAKILAATFMYLSTKNAAQRQQAEQIILAGIAREQQMVLPGRGFAMYPGDSYISSHYSALAVRYLWKLRQLDRLDGISPSLRAAARAGVQMADTIAPVHNLQPVPTKIQSVEDAYAVASGNGDIGSARAFVEGLIDASGPQITLRHRNHAVAERSALAYSAATLLAAGELRLGIKIADQVTQQFNAGGALYSTVDSVAAIALMIQLRASGVVSGEGRLRVNGKEMSAKEAATLADQVESIEVLDGVAAIEVTQIVEEDWNSYASAFPVKIGFRDNRGRQVHKMKMGNRLDLHVALPDGYTPGDLVHVALPPSMAWIQGGGKVKRFTLDFEGKNELSIPLVVTSNIEGKQHFATCVRNMFEEERAASPGLIAVQGVGKWFRR